MSENRLATNMLIYFASKQIVRNNFGLFTFKSRLQTPSIKTQKSQTQIFKSHKTDTKFTLTREKCKTQLEKLSN